MRAFEIILICCFVLLGICAVFLMFEGLCLDIALEDFVCGEIVDKNAESEVGDFYLVIKVPYKFLWYETFDNVSFRVSYDTYKRACVGQFYDVKEFILLDEST